MAYTLLRWPDIPHPAVVATAAAVATASLVAVAKTTLWPARKRVLPSPLKTVLPRASREELRGLVYLPDAFPGARDVETPYGTIRVYEFGPERGDKVLLVHGISTSCITLGRIAHALVERGCRVMLFDLFGRGFTDGVGDIPHDTRLYTTQMLLVLASSRLCWTGARGFRLIGYSLGGAIAVPFSNAFPHMVSSLVLLAPAGLIDAAAFGAVSRFVFSSGLVPERVLAVLAGRRLQRPLVASPTSGAAAAVLAVAEAEKLGGDRSPLEERVLDYVRWMVLNHEGFVPAFTSCVRHAPLTEQHEEWRGLARRERGTTAVIFAETDELISADDYARDGLPLVGGEGHVFWRVVPGSHDFVMTHVSAIMRELDEFWGMSA
ncbi:Alpha/beta hydrolase fold-1 [Metarhizium album ARSEF 1941]|uniref:Alpha/beta hydrolase fold-1 n=1 Tax=Metarhizium album (strain ARSEF 1941) TaxID=1081103 RepID=A0A0B2WRN3_METAS|nr:Alpha/beta hydrolase fold-1 [Metarhizium album ARSEF 1941]KHN96249.1 Alpha/beta hydrolase fold-1 [Metarhizium album ARSEF 1941]